MHTISLLDNVTSKPIGATSIPHPPCFNDTLHMGDRYLDIVHVTPGHVETDGGCTIRTYVVRVKQRALPQAANDREPKPWPRTNVAELVADLRGCNVFCPLELCAEAANALERLAAGKEIGR